MKPYDVIIAGGGAAGLSLAYHLVRSPLRDCSILIVEKEAKDQDDRTWCFWTDQPTLFDDIVYRSWSQLQILGEHFAKTLDLQTYRYNMIRGIDFYRFARQALSMYPYVEFLQGKVERIEDGDQYGSVQVNGQSYTGTWVFDSLFSCHEFKPDQIRYHSLKQQFKGWEIETPGKAFNPQEATFLDFRTSQQQGMHFFYVLPFSERHALVESVLCTAAPIGWQAGEQALSVYLNTILDIKEYSIRREEQGISPLTDQPFQRQIGRHIMSIGTLGGRIKPSTGYAFIRMQEDSSAIVRSLLRVGHPFRVPSSPRRYRYYDSIMLEIMTHHGERIQPIFTALFEHNPAERIFHFLDEKASLRENLLMVPSLPPRLLLQALLRLDALHRV
jgi:lycopene beta-cyclase